VTVPGRALTFGSLTGVDTRCDRCGYAAEDYSSETAQRWLKRALSVHARLVFEGLPGAAELPGIGDEAQLAGELARAAEEADLHEAVHLAHVAAARSAVLVADGLIGASGAVLHVNTSEGGVPKRPIDEAAVSWRGLVGDHQRDRKHHGQARQALCLWSSEVIGALRGEGHPIFAGAAGENLTLSGLNWAAMRTGLRLELGGVVCELTGPSTPCHNQSQWFSDRDFERIDHDVKPGWSRWYAFVVRPGEVRPGDAVRVLAPVTVG
jgi:MOSC domain-containing protein YiiM